MRLLIISFAILSIISCSHPTHTEDQNEIIRLRKLSNKAIAEHDSIGVSKYWMDNFFIITSRDYQIQGKEENKKLFAQEFTTKNDVIYIRTPDAVTIMPAWNMASEYGHWEGRWTDGDERILIKGDYYAKWHKVDGSWLLRAEIFTPTFCTGGQYCN